MKSSKGGRMSRKKKQADIDRTLVTKSKVVMIIIVEKITDKRPLKKPLVRKEKRVKYDVEKWNGV